MNKIPGKQLLKLVIMRFFTSPFCRTFVNTIVPIIVSIYFLEYNENIKWTWYIPVVVIILGITIFNIFAEYLLAKEKKELEYMDLLKQCYRNQSAINRRSASKIYRLNKVITKHLKNNKPIEKLVFDKVADFNTISFDICNSIYQMIENKFGEQTECEVTVYQSTNKGISMIAFANRRNEPPTSYNTTYKKSDNKYLFLKLFDNLNAQIFVCPNKESVQNNFTWIEGSDIREKKICQYIGIPLKTDRNKIELLLQIDVSKPNIFGKTKKEVIKIAENLFYPYVVLLNKAYERDLIFDGYYDIIVEKLCVKREKNS